MVVVDGWPAKAGGPMSTFWPMAASRPRYFCVEGEGECTSESSRGQFSIFGATEENTRREFRRGKERKKKRKSVRRGRFMAVIQFAALAGARNLGTGAQDCPQSLHRKCRKADLNV
jgi:hypothetical protein